MSSRLTRSSQRAGAHHIGDSGSYEESTMKTIKRRNTSSADRHQASEPIQLDPNRRFNPDVLLNIADMLVDEQDYETVINLSGVSSLFGASLKPYLARLRRKLILKLDDLNLEETAGWSTIKYIECSRASPYPILRHLAADVQFAQKNDIQRTLKPTVIRYMGIPHECVFRLQKELFPSARIIRCLYDPSSQDLSSVFGSTSTKVGETAFGLFQRMVPYGGPVYYDDPPRESSGIRVIEYQKKGFEFRDLNLLPGRQIQSSIQIKASGGLKVYREHYERYDKQGESMQYLVANRYLKNIKVVDRPDLEHIAIKIYMKPTPGTGTASLMTSANGYAHGFRAIYDHVETIAKEHLCQAYASSIKFQLYFIHGSSTPMIRRPDYTRYEGRQSRTRDRDSPLDSDDMDSESNYSDHSDYEDEEEPEPNEQPPVYTLEFTRNEGKVRTTESSMDKDVLGCAWNGGCSRCRNGAAAASSD